MAIFKKKKDREQGVPENARQEEMPQTDTAVSQEKQVTEPLKIESENTPEGVFKRFRNGLSKTRNSFTGRMDPPLHGSKRDH